MKLRIFSCFCLFFTISITAQTEWRSLPVPAGISVLLTIDFSDQYGFSGGWRWGQNFDVEAAAVNTSDGGDSWEFSSLPDSIRSVICSRLFSNSTGIAAAAYNHNINPGKNFKNYITELYEKRDYAKLGYALIGDANESNTGGIILKTIDAGATWFDYSVLPDSFNYITGACFIDEKEGFILAKTDSLTYILKSIDGGLTWQSKFRFPPNSGSMSIVFSSPQNGVAAGYNARTSEQGFVAVTSDSGENWNYQFITQAGNLAAASYSDENTFYVTGQNFQNSYVFKSTNAGLDWVQTSFGSTQLFLSGINFIEGENAGFIFGNDLSLTQLFAAKTLDRGITWEEPEFIPSFADYSLVGSKIVDGNNVYLTGGNIVSQGLILRTENAALSVESGLSETHAFSLQQNYPNPFNPSTKVSFVISSASGGSFVSLKVYDLLGREVSTLVNEYKPAGSYNVSWNAADFPSGVYYYRLQAGSEIQVRKMVLMK